MIIEHASSSLVCIGVHNHMSGYVSAITKFDQLIFKHRYTSARISK